MIGLLREHYNEVVVLAVTSLLGLTAGVVGGYAVLRRRSLLGDAIGHATLPGLCLGYALAGSRSLPWLLAGALGTSLLALGCYAALRRVPRIREDAAIALVLSAFYAVGVVGLTLIAQGRSSGQAGLESFLFGKTSGILLSDLYWVGGLACVTLVVTALLAKEFLATSFDPGFAAAQGWPVATLDFALLVLLATTMTLALASVGAILAAALVTIPASAARFWTDRVARMLALSATFGFVSAASGAWLSARVDRLPAGPTIVLCAVALFVLSLGARRLRRA